MSKDPAFLFYPGDYLRDTQCFSEKVQVSYDRIMCEHMRNICISKKQLNFFTKKLNEDELEELKMALTAVNGGFQIEWVAESIIKRRAYSDSRRKNREKHMLTYDKHMENENENENRNKDKRFKVPNIDDISLYCKERKNKVDPERFFDFYESKGWMVGKNKMKSWQAAVRNWEKSDKEEQKKQPLNTRAKEEYKPDWMINPQPS